jgi:hypothetical protein
MSSGTKGALDVHPLYALPCRFLAEATGLLEYKHDARSAITLDFVAAILECVAVCPGSSQASVHYDKLDASALSAFMRQAQACFSQWHHRLAEHVTLRLQAMSQGAPRA